MTWDTACYQTIDHGRAKTTTDAPGVAAVAGHRAALIGQCGSVDARGASRCHNDRRCTRAVTARNELGRSSADPPGHNRTAIAGAANR
jgi:hypothetical protein